MSTPIPDPPTLSSVTKSDGDGVYFAPDVRVRHVEAPNWAIERLSGEGRPRWVVVGFYGSFGAAVRALADHHVHLLTKLEAGDVAHVVAELARVREHVAAALREVTP